MKRTRLALILVVLAVAMSAFAVRAQDKKVIKVASQGPLSGGQANSGVALRNGIELALEQLSSPLKDMGFDVQYVPFDDQAKPDVGVSNAQQIVADAAILGVVGHWNSGVAIPSSKVYEDNNLVMVSPANTNPQVTDRGLKVVNRVCGRDDLQGPTGAQFAFNDLKVKSVYILHDTTTYGQGVAEFFRQEAEKLGIKVLGFEGTEEKANFEAIYTPILAQSPDLVYTGGIFDQMAVFISQIRGAGYKGFLMGPDGLDGADFAKLAGEAGVGVYYTSAGGPAALYPNAAKFVEDYKTKFNADPLPYAAQAYDATAVVLLGIEAAAKEAGGNIPSREAVAKAVRATKDYKGLTGTITFDANGDPQVATYFVLQVAVSDSAKWAENKMIKQLEIPSPLYAKAMESMEMTPEATPGS
jgi:branched-chain amino acid transport system substrate-binding protein